MAACTSGSKNKGVSDNTKIKELTHCTKNEEIRNGKLHFLCSVRSRWKCKYLLKMLKDSIGSLIRNLKVDGCQSNVYVMLKQLFFFHEFYNFFCRWHFLMNWPCYNNLFQFMQHENFRNLNRMIFVYWKHIGPRVNDFCYRIWGIKRYTFD